MKSLKILTCYVVDDEGHSVNHLSDLIGDTKGLILEGSSTNPIKALREVAKPNGPDLTFLDVDMPEMSGIDFAMAARSYTSIIFITSMPQYVQDIFKGESFAYLPKPISHEKFLLCIKEIRSGLKR